MSDSTDKVNARNLENLHIVSSVVEMIPGYNPSSELISKTANNLQRFAKTTENN